MSQLNAAGSGSWADAACRGALREPQGQAELPDWGAGEAASRLGSSITVSHTVQQYLAR